MNGSWRISDTEEDYERLHRMIDDVLRNQNKPTPPPEAFPPDLVQWMRIKFERALNTGVRKDSVIPMVIYEAREAFPKLTDSEIVNGAMMVARLFGPNQGEGVGPTIEPETFAPEMQQYLDYMKPNYGSRLAQIPATYSEDDPFDVSSGQELVNDLHTGWYEEPPDVQRQAIANAFRSTIISPRTDLKSNAIAYQDLMHIPPEESNPDIFENTIRQAKAKWDKFGQMTLDQINQGSNDPEHLAYAPHLIQKYNPPIWGNVRRAANVGPYIEQMRRAALDDVAQGGDGRIWREEVLNMGIPGVGPKVASFMWLMLAPKTSRLATIDTHMMKHLGQEQESPSTLAQYFELEKRLDEQRRANGYDDVPLGAYQWAVWDHQRSPGFHQDHTALRPLNPVDWRNIDWAPKPVPSRAQPQEVSPQQQKLFGGRLSPPLMESKAWKLRRS